ncbi:uncharacterized protein ARMOST_09564 [Armillaria ostoyae]|uniref:DH domain-containing protein n=1 Tax=Armillaria ostoyae TaxID=47428 RepID=A0A284RBV1_ARMOS|nr:uncharacterized protein ARMOST_09564 [Armillaria ostoyae]
MVDVSHLFLQFAQCNSSPSFLTDWWFSGQCRVLYTLTGPVVICTTDKSIHRLLSSPDPTTPGVTTPGVSTPAAKGHDHAAERRIWKQVLTLSGTRGTSAASSSDDAYHQEGLSFSSTHLSAMHAMTSAAIKVSKSTKRSGDESLLPEVNETHTPSNDIRSTLAKCLSSHSHMEVHSFTPDLRSPSSMSNPTVANANQVTTFNTNPEYSPPAIGQRMTQTEGRQGIPAPSRTDGGELGRRQARPIRGQGEGERVTISKSMWYPKPAPLRMVGGGGNSSITEDDEEYGLPSQHHRGVVGGNNNVDDDDDTDDTGELVIKDFGTGLQPPRAGTGSSEERVYKDDKGKRAMVVQEIVACHGADLCEGSAGAHGHLHQARFCAPVNMLTGGSRKETIVPPSERKVVFNGVDALFSFHKESFLPSLEVAPAPLMKLKVDQDTDTDGQLSLNVAKAVGKIFVKHAGFMKMYSSYINNFDHSVQRVKYWTSVRNVSGSASPGSTMSPSSSTAQLVGLGLTMSAVSSPTVVESSSGLAELPNLSHSQRKRIRSYLTRCGRSPRHPQLKQEGYLLLRVQCIPLYRLLLEVLLRSTPPSYDFMEDPLDGALSEISLVAKNMNEGKRESESRRKLVQWQARIRGNFPSPLVQPHRYVYCNDEFELANEFDDF